jgi:hypothetical protein
VGDDEPKWWACPGCGFIVGFKLPDGRLEVWCGQGKDYRPIYMNEADWLCSCGYRKVWKAKPTLTK